MCTESLQFLLDHVALVCVPDEGNHSKTVEYGLGLMCYAPDYSNPVGPGWLIDWKWRWCVSVIEFIVSRGVYNTSTIHILYIPR